MIFQLMPRGGGGDQTWKFEKKIWPPAPHVDGKLKPFVQNKILSE